jgi:CNT family concentrative nucleoside transporter
LGIKRKEGRSMHIVKSLAGMALILLIAYLLSSNRKAIKLRVVGAAFALQAGFAALVLVTAR